MPLYESIFIVRQDVPAAQVETLTTSLAELITKNGGTVSKTEQWGLRNLAYRINKNKKGHYVLFNIDAPSAAVLEFERTMKINEDVLRFMSVRVEELEAAPSAVMRKDERPDRPFGERGGFDRGGDRPRRAPRRDEPESSEGAAA